MSAAHPLASSVAPRFAVDYVLADAPAALLSERGVLAVLGFGDAAPASDADPRYLHVPLQPHAGVAPYEVWRTGEPVRCGRDGQIAWSSNGQLAFGVIEVEEGDGGIIEAASHAYARLTSFIRDSDTPHLLRIWNYLDAITQGDGDAERYRQFCVGRARGLGEFDPTRLPAATPAAAGARRRAGRRSWRRFPPAAPAARRHAGWRGRRRWRCPTAATADAARSAAASRARNSAAAGRSCAGTDTH